MKADLSWIIMCWSIMVPILGIDVFLEGRGSIGLGVGGLVLLGEGLGGLVLLLGFGFGLGFGGGGGGSLYIRVHIFPLGV